MKTRTGRKHRPLIEPDLIMAVYLGFSFSIALWVHYSSVCCGLYFRDKAGFTLLMITFWLA